MPDTESFCLQAALASTFARLHLEPVVSPSQQVRAAHESVLLVAEPDLALVVVTGGDRASWLNGLVTCDVAKLEDGACAYGLAVTQKGRIITDLFVTKRGDAIDVVLPARVRDAVMDALEKYLVMEDAEMARDDSRHVWFAHGPKSNELGIACDRTGLGGAIVIAPAEERDRLAERVASAGGVVGDAAGWEALRIERGVPAFGVDFDEKTYPQEASLEKRAVSFDKGCYLGQEVVCMLELRGHVKRKLVPFVMEDGAATPGATVTDDAGVEIGKVSSAWERTGLAMLKLAHTEPGAKVHIAGKPARVVDTKVSDRLVES
jgi:folate-binding protein YgfZ